MYSKNRKNCIKEQEKENFIKFSIKISQKIFIKKACENTEIFFDDWIKNDLNFDQTTKTPLHPAMLIY